MFKVQNPVRFVFWQIACALTGIIIAAPTAANSLDARYLEGLRQRRLFELAEAYCTDRLSRPQDEATQAELTIELIRTLAMHATNVPQEERAQLWTKARGAAREFVSRSPNHPRLILVRLQDALTALAQGEFGRQEHEAGALAASELEPTRAALREATSLLEELDRELTREIPLRRRASPAVGELTADQLFSLQQQVQHQLARAHRNRALLFERGTDDRLALLLAAVETLQRSVAQLAADEPLTPLVQLDLAECQRLLGRYAEAGELAAKLDQSGIEPPIRLRARGEMIRLAIAQGNPSELQRLVDEGRTIDGQSAAELDFARFEAFLELARSAGAGRPPTVSGKPAAEIARQYQDQAAAAAQLLETTYGSYWSRRADQRLISALPRGDGGNVQLLMRAAETAYLQGKLDEAIAAYDDASAAARKAGDLNLAFDLAYKAALVEQRRKEHVSATNRLRILSKSFATHEKAAPAHLLAAWNAAQALSTSPAAGDSYAAILREHLATWPKAGSADQARIWLGKLLETRGQWREAVDAYAGVERSSPHFAPARIGLAECWPRYLEELAAAGKATSEPAAEAIGMLQQLLLDEDHHLPERWTEADRALALTIAELIVAHQPAQSAEAVRILESALKDSEGATGSWKAAAQVPLALALADQPGRRGEAQAALARLAKENPDNGAIQEKHAAVLLASDDPETLKQALANWRIIASRSQPRSPRWYRAKYSVAHAQFKLGDRTNAAALLKFVLETPPGLKGTEWEAQYLDLLRKSESR